DDVREERRARADAHPAPDDDARRDPRSRPDLRAGIDVRAGRDALVRQERSGEELERPRKAEIRVVDADDRAARSVDAGTEDHGSRARPREGARVARVREEGEVPRAGLVERLEAVDLDRTVA